MANFLEDIKRKIKDDLSPDEISVFDNSHLHKKHKSFSPEKFHLKLVVKSNKLKKMGKIEAHKLIYSVLKNEMMNKIHALEIKII